jgi:tRNA(fMet)-specific endonuclease VapC
VSLIFDTDLLTILETHSQPFYNHLQARLLQHPQERSYATIVSFQEHVRGWMSYLNQARTPKQIILAYDRLESVLKYFSTANVLSFSPEAQNRFEELRRQRVRIGTLDLRIASIALVTDCLLLSRNLRDFRKVPGLRVEDWTLPL